jgi:hypothetical protein
MGGGSAGTGMARRCRLEGVLGVIVVQFAMCITCHHRAT